MLPCHHSELWVYYPSFTSPWNTRGRNTYLELFQFSQVLFLTPFTVKAKHTTGRHHLLELYSFNYFMLYFLYNSEQNRYDKILCITGIYALIWLVWMFVFYGLFLDRTSSNASLLSVISRLLVWGSAPEGETTLIISTLWSIYLSPDHHIILCYNFHFDFCF